MVMILEGDGGSDDVVDDLHDVVLDDDDGQRPKAIQPQLDLTISPLTQRIRGCLVSSLLSKCLVFPISEYNTNSNILNKKIPIYKRVPISTVSHSTQFKV